MGKVREGIRQEVSSNTFQTPGTGLFGYWAYGADKKFLGKNATEKKCRAKR